MNPIVSVVVPVYNVEKYIPYCIDSICNQTLKDIEIILVDDGSTDSSGFICDEYAKKDKRIKVFHKLNGGLSDARNFGLDQCNGEYIGFVDGDDIIDPRMYEFLLTEMKRQDASIATCYSQRFDVINNIVRDMKEKSSFCLETREEMIEYLFCKVKTGLSISVCLKLYKKDIFEKIRFVRGMTVEDGLIFLDTIKRAKRMVVVPYRLYFYRFRVNSITQQRTWNDNILDVIQVYQHNYDVICKEYPKAIDAAEARKIWSYREALKKISLLNEKNKEVVKSIQKSLARAICRGWRTNKFLTTSDIVKSIIFLIDIRFYKMFLNMRLL
ncbi:glycosyltransferase family 2 protein [Selenomonas montiformis]|uniref:glycosyltransferase family 2 protein n=1 Tax=Selenomonas montiformis TaxID=2652285 RepID=UPI0039F6150E